MRVGHATCTMQCGSLLFSSLRCAAGYNLYITQRTAKVRFRRVRSSSVQGGVHRECMHRVLYVHACMHAFAMTNIYNAPLYTSQKDVLVSVLVLAVDVNRKQDLYIYI